jgi:hypothetical protein
VDDDAGFSILFPEGVTSTERYRVISRKQRSFQLSLAMIRPDSLNDGAAARGTWRRSHGDTPTPKAVPRPSQGAQLGRILVTIGRRFTFERFRVD